MQSVQCNNREAKLICYVHLLIMRQFSMNLTRICIYFFKFSSGMCGQIVSARRRSKAAYWYLARLLFISASQCACAAFFVRLNSNVLCVCVCVSKVLHFDLNCPRIPLGRYSFINEHECFIYCDDSRTFFTSLMYSFLSIKARIFHFNIILNWTLNTRAHHGGSRCCCNPMCAFYCVET